MRRSTSFQPKPWPPFSARQLSETMGPTFLAQLSEPGVRRVHCSSTPRRPADGRQLGGHSGQVSPRNSNRKVRRGWQIDIFEISALRVAGPLHRETHHFGSSAFLPEQPNDRTSEACQKPPFVRGPSPSKNGRRVGSNRGGATTDTDIPFRWRSDRGRSLRPERSEHLLSH